MPFGENPIFTAINWLMIKFYHYEWAYASMYCAHTKLIRLSKWKMDFMLIEKPEKTCSFQSTSDSSLFPHKNVDETESEFVLFLFCWSEKKPVQYKYSSLFVSQIHFNITRHRHIVFIARISQHLRQQQYQAFLYTRKTFLVSFYFATWLNFNNDSVTA